MTQVREHKQTLMPYNPHMLNMNVQDVVDEILGAEPDEEQVHKATQEYIRQTSYEERIKLGIMVSERVVQHRHLIEAITEQIIDDAHNDLDAMMENGDNLPEINDQALTDINETRIYRNLLRMTIEEMAYHIDRLPQPNGEDVYQQFLDVPAEMQETVDAAVQASLTEHAPELQDLKRRIFQGIRDRMPSTNQAG